MTLNFQDYFILIKRDIIANVQIICDADLNITAINARYPGSVHDAAIWSISRIFHDKEQQYEEVNFLKLVNKTMHKILCF